MSTKSADQYEEKEAQERFEAALRGGLKGSPPPHAEMKLGKPKNKKAAPKGKKDAKR